ncbi:MAG TPA: hypothetical protein VKB51_01795 [bacterium]|nr:hypothetical protein [bacterium]
MSDGANGNGRDGREDDAGPEHPPGPAPGTTPHPAPEAPGAVVPFAPRPRRAKAARSAPEGLTGLDAVGPDAPDDVPLEERVRELAARGLDEAEIRALLRLPGRLKPRAERQLMEAFREGQLLGRARIKQAQYEAALQGRVTAQTQVLARLGDPWGEEGGEIEQGDVDRGNPSPQEPGG